MSNPIALSVPEAVQASGLARSRIYESLRSGELVARKAGRRTLILAADLEAFLNGLPTYQAEA